MKYGINLSVWCGNENTLFDIWVYFREISIIFPFHHISNRNHCQSKRERFFFSFLVSEHQGNHNNMLKRRFFLLSNIIFESTWKSNRKPMKIQQEQDQKYIRITVAGELPILKTWMISILILASDFSVGRTSRAFICFLYGNVYLKWFPSNPAFLASIVLLWLQMRN